jgi:hypothetical protein
MSPFRRITDKMPGKATGKVPAAEAGTPTPMTDDEVLAAISATRASFPAKPKPSAKSVMLNAKPGATGLTAESEASRPLIPR